MTKAQWKKLVAVINGEVVEPLAVGTADEVRRSMKAALDSVADKRRIILSCGGGMPPGVLTENIEAFLSAVGTQS